MSGNANILAGLEELIDEVIQETLQGDDMSAETYMAEQPTLQLKWRNLEHWLAENNDGPNGKRLERFRRTKDQMQRELSREDAFNEYNVKVSTGN